MGVDGRSQPATAFLIAYRFATVRLADRIGVLGRGRISEEGSPDELLRLGGTCARLRAAGHLEPAGAPGAGWSKGYDESHQAENRAMIRNARPDVRASHVVPLARLRDTIPFYPVAERSSTVFWHGPVRALHSSTARTRTFAHCQQR
ncbi:MAG TPA: hypothetical protein VGF67_09445 [Ktedonobacteraceae bacterium]